MIERLVSVVDATPKGEMLMVEQRMPGAPATVTNWPRVLGILGIVLGVLSILNKLDDLLLSPALHSTSWWSRVVGPELGTQIVRWLPPPLWLLTSSLIGIGLGVLLLVASLNLRRRQRAGASLTRTWAWLAIAWLVVQAATSSAWMLRLGPEIDELSSATWQLPAALGIAITFALLAIYPVFILVWFARPPIQAEVAGWPE